jgi:hypothetical protein
MTNNDPTKMKEMEEQTNKRTNEQTRNFVHRVAFIFFRRDVLDLKP